MQGDVASTPPWPPERPTDWWRRIFDACVLVRLLGTNLRSYTCDDARVFLHGRGVDGVKRDKIDYYCAAEGPVEESGPHARDDEFAAQLLGPHDSIRTSPCRLGDRRGTPTTSTPAPGPGGRRGSELDPWRFLSRRPIASSGASRTSPSQVEGYIAFTNLAHSRNVTLTAWLVTGDVTLREEYAPDERCVGYCRG